MQSRLMKPVSSHPNARTETLHFIQWQLGLKNSFSQSRWWAINEHIYVCPKPKPCLHKQICRSESSFNELPPVLTQCKAPRREYYWTNSSPWLLRSRVFLKFVGSVLRNGSKVQRTPRMCLDPHVGSISCSAQIHVCLDRFGLFLHPAGTMSPHPEAGFELFKTRVEQEAVVIKMSS